MGMGLADNLGARRSHPRALAWSGEKVRRAMRVRMAAQEA